MNFLRRLFGNEQQSSDDDDIDDLGWIFESLLPATDHVSSEDDLEAAYVNERGNTYYNQFVHDGDPADLQRAIDTYEEAVALTPDSSFNRLMYQSNLWNVLSIRYERTGDATDLQLPIDVYEQTIGLTILDPNYRAVYLNNLATRLRDRYASIGELDDLQQAIELYHQALALTSTGVGEYAIYMNNLGTALHYRYYHSGSSDDLRDFIAAFEKAVKFTPHSSSDHVLFMNNLGNGLRDRYYRNGDVTDIQRALEIYREALTLAAKATSNRAMVLNGLGCAFKDRYGHTSDEADLQQAIDAFEEAASITEQGPANRAAALGNLANGLSTHCERGKNPDLLNKAIEAWQLAISIAPLNLPERAKYLFGLGGGFHTRYILTGWASDLQMAFDAAMATKSVITIGSSIYVSNTALLARILQSRYTCTNELTDLQQSIAAYREACEQGLNVNPAMTLSASCEWARWANRRTARTEAASAFAFALRAVEQLLPIQTLRAGKQSWLHRTQTLFGQAAYTQAQNDEMLGAVAILETGRAQLLAEAVERYRVDLALLPKRGQEELHKRYIAALQRLTQLETVESQSEKTPSAFDLIAEFQTARAEFKQVIEDIRQVPGYEDLFQTPTFEQVRLMLTVERGVCVYVLVVPEGGLALLVHAGGVKEVWFDLAEQEVNAWLFKRDGSQITGGYLPAQMGDVPFDTQLNDVLPLLGERVMQTVADTLRSLNAPDVTLIPCGRLALFPLHAAEYQVDGQTRRFMDDFTVSYTPSARALGSCQEGLAALKDKLSTLCAVGNPLPLPERVKPLDYAQFEVEEIASLFGETATLLSGKQATRETLDAQLGRTTYLHLSCHGTFNAQDPLQSGVILSNGEMLTLKDLLGGQRLRGTRLVVLSACQTAITDFTDLPEEAIGLPGGFVQAGVPGVVGTLWPVNDLSTMLLMVKFYEAHLKDGLAPAAALRKAQLWLRDVTNAELSELFAQYKLTATGRPSTRMAYEMASEKFREHTLRDPNEKPYAHPYYWAPFVFYGM